MSILGAFVKQPDEIETYTIQYDKNFTVKEGEEITSVEVKVEVTKRPEDFYETNELTEDTVKELVWSIDGKGDAEIVSYIWENAPVPYVRVWLGGGFNKTVYKVTVTCKTTYDRIVQDEFKVKIKEF